ncbi:MAG TPA: CDP-diacylglycerol--serine O-phosphatidyltransferase [Woeseiaceae bacterium]|nr:CDP-diacylglycerol--serine O-phosphatidyltransferase [Woeseiaceae bacterium]
MAVTTATNRHTLVSRIRYSIPNGLTALSLLLGLASIVTMQFGDLELAAWLIVWCGLLDTLDGVAARMLNATSSFGAEFDSMADVIAFGVAPAILIVNVGVQVGDIAYDSGQFWVLLLASGVFALAGAMRLARFNIDTDKPKDGWFTGVPITACGGGILSSLVLVLVLHRELAASLPLHLYLPVLMFVLSLLMISRIRFPKATIRNSKLINVFQIVNIALIFYCGITRSYPEYLLGIGIVLIVGGIIAGRISQRDTAEQSN